MPTFAKELRNNIINNKNIFDMKKNFEIQLVSFPGFYESSFYNSDTEYWEVKDFVDWYEEENGVKINPDDVVVDDEGYQRDCCEAFVGAFALLAPDFVESAEYSGMTSPRFYNFETDRLYANVVLADDWQTKVLQWMKKNEADLTKVIKDEWSDRDGFWSFLDNTFEGWYRELAKAEPDERYVSEIIYYMMRENDKDIYEHLIDDTLEDVHFYEFLSYEPKEAEKEA